METNQTLPFQGAALYFRPLCSAVPEWWRSYGFWNNINDEKVRPKCYLSIGVTIAIRILKCINMSPGVLFKSNVTWTRKTRKMAMTNMENGSFTWILESYWSMMYVTSRWHVHYNAKRSQITSWDKGKGIEVETVCRFCYTNIPPMPWKYSTLQIRPVIQVPIHYRFPLSFACTIFQYRWQAY